MPGLFRILPLILLSMASCSEKVYILEGRDFNSGEWLLVNENIAKRRSAAIAHNGVLMQNVRNLCVSWNEEDGGTTCDGWLRLYRDGELVAEQHYLDDFSLSEGYALKSAYKYYSFGSIDPVDANDYKRLWDSLKKIPGCYPTRYHEQPADKDIIQFYKLK